MAVSINHNGASLLIQRNLDSVGEALNTTLERLSSGQKINRAADDPTGLAVSQKIRNEIRGLRQNLRNINDGISVTSTIESSLSTMTQRLQRLRELALLASSDSHSANDRRVTNIEAQQILDELADLVTRAEFNGKKLLDGTYVNSRVFTGVSSGQYVTISVPSMMTDTLGALATVTSANKVGDLTIAGDGDVIINGVTVPATVDDTVSSHSKDGSAVAKAAAINSISAQTDVTATVEPTEYSAAGASISAVTLDGGATTLSINGVSLGALTVVDGDTDNNLRSRINMLTAQTGVVASLGAGGELVLTAEDGRNVRIETTGSVGDELGLRATDGDTLVTWTGKITLTSDRTINVGGTNYGKIGFTPGQVSTNVDPATALAQVGTTTRDDAVAALATIDAALKAILETRATVGSMQGRLDSTAESITITIEDLSACDSRIRDADFALETARLVQNQILQDAGLALLAQANTMPRNVLEMLLM